jgi:hypothetical protein
MNLPPDLRAIIDEDLERIRAALQRQAPSARLALAGSLAFEEPEARRDERGGWSLQSDYDLYLVVPGLGECRRLLREPALKDLGTRLGTRAPVDPWVLWAPLLKRGWAGMVGRWLNDGSFVDCRLDRRSLRVNQARKSLLRQRLLAPRELPERARYQRVKAAIEALRAHILLHSPEPSLRALFSLEANLRWLRSHPATLGAAQRDALAALLEARLDLEGPGPQAAALQQIEPWILSEAQEQIRALRTSPRQSPLPSSTELRAWLGLLRHGLLPDPRLDYDAELLALLADPACPRLAGEPSAREAFGQHWRRLALPSPLPRGPERLTRAVDAALGNPVSGKAERFLIPRRAP